MTYQNTSIVIILISALCSMPAFAEDKPHSLKQKNSVVKTLKKPTELQISEQMEDKQARDKQMYILKIDDLSDRIWAEKNLKLKQMLMEEQLQLIKKHLKKKRMMKKMMMQQQQKES